MPRPAPTVLLESIEQEKVVQVIATPELWMVLYKGQPFGLKHSKPKNSALSEAPKYFRTTFPHKGHALVLVRRLNERFSTTDFSCVVLKDFSSTSINNQ